MNDNNKRLTEYEMLCQLNDLISDRMFCLSIDEDGNEIFRKDIKAIKQIIYDYKILKRMALNDVTQEKDIDFMWIKENIENKNVELINYWRPNLKDIKINVRLYKNNKQLGNFIVSYDKNEFDNMNFYLKIKLNKDFVDFKTCIEALAYKSFDKLLDLPKLSKCSSLLQMLYKETLSSETSKFSISIDERDERMSNKEIAELKREIKQYNLEDVLSVNSVEHKITSYRDLGTRFNNDLDFRRIKCYER